MDSALKGSDKYFGSPSCLLFTLAPTFHVYRPTGLAKNFALYNPPQKGQLATTSYLSRSSGPPVPEVLGFGGQTARFRMVLEDDMKVLRWHASDTTYGAHPAPGGAPAEGVRQVRALRSSFGGRMQVLTTARPPVSPQVRALELWGCGGADADKVLRELRSRRVRDASRAGKVDRGAMFGLGKGNDWRSEDNPDRMILETAGAHTFYSHQLEKLPDENH
jgi:TLD